MTKPVLVVINTKTLLCRRFEGNTCTLKVQAFEPLFASEIEQIRNRPETIGRETEEE